MPIYEYRCDKGHAFEVVQHMIDEPVTSCETCGRPVQRVFHPVAVHFKGKGFYNTDYGTRQRQRETAAAAEGSSSGSSDSSSSSDSKSSDSSSANGAKSAEKRPPTKPKAEPATK